MRERAEGSAAKRFLGKALRGLKDWKVPRVINTDRAHAHDIAIASLQAKGKRDVEVQRRLVKRLNCYLEGDHGRRKRLITPTLGFKSMKTAYATLKGFEAMGTIRKGQTRAWSLQRGILWARRA